MRKNKTWEITLTDNSRLVANEPIENAVVYTTDTEAYLNFRVIDSGFDFDSATIAMLNKDDGSIVERPMSKEVETAVYEIESDIIPHFGLWQAQVLFKQGDEIFTSTPVTFVIERYMMAEQPPRLEDVVNWQRLYDNATETIQELTRINDELTTTNETVQQAEAQRVLAENERSEKYGSYAQQFNDVITDLSEEKDYHSLPEISAARGGHDTLGQRLDGTTAQLAQKVGGGNKAELEDLSSTVLSAIEGGEGTSFNLLSVPQNRSVTPEKTTFIESSSNLFNKDDIVPGKRISPDGTISGADERYGYSHIIHVDPNQTYYLVGAYEIAWYDENDNFILRIQHSASSGRPLEGWYATAPADARIARINFHMQSIYWSNSTVQVSLGSSPVPYEKYYGYRLSNEITVFAETDGGTTSFSVADFGAKGDGLTDDTQAIKNAVSNLKTRGGGQLYFPKGIYMISETIVLPSHVTLYGDGMRLSVIKAIEGTVFDLYKPLDNIHEKNYHRTMLTFESSGDDGLNTLDNLTENVHIEDLTFDWNFSPVNHSQYSIATILVDRAKQITFRRVKIANPIQQEDTKRLGSAIMFSFSNQCYMYNCELDKADYESLCVRFLSKDIHFINSTILDNFPTDIYSFTPSHYLQLARPTLAADELKRRFGEEMAGPLYVEGCHFEIDTDFNSDLACVHYSKGFYFRNNYIKHNGNYGSGQTIIKPLDFAEDIEVSGNYFDWSEWGEGEPTQIPTLINIPRTAGNCKNIKFNNNIAKLNVPDSVTKFDNIQIIGINRGHNDNVEIKDNFVHLMSYPNIGFNVFGIMQGELSGNKILAENPSSEITSSGPRGVITFAGKDGENGKFLTIKDNTIIAPDKIGVGLEVKDANITSGVFQGNDFSDSVVGYTETTTTTGTTEKIKWHRFKDNIGVSLKADSATLATGQTPALSVPLTDVKGINFDDSLVAKYNPTEPVANVYKLTHSFEWTGTAFNLVFNWVTDPGVNVDINYRIEVEN